MSRWLAGGLLGAAWLLGGCDRTPVPSAVSPASPAGEFPASPPWFREVTGASGVDFVHRAGTRFDMPDQVGSGVALLDADGDGRLDVYLVQNGGEGPSARNQLYLQEPTGRFRNASEGSGADLAGRGMGAIAGDANNDGRPELVVTEYGGVRLLWNQGGGVFRPVGAASGLDNPRWAAPASFLDFDRDGWLDLVVGNYVDYDPTQICQDAQGRQDFCAPGSFAPTVMRLWRNVTATPGAAPRFEDVTETSGMTRAPGVSLGLVCADFDGDGWVDIFSADDGRANRLWINRRNGTFVEEAAVRGLAYNAMGRTAANMGTAYADCDGDGLGDLFVTHLSEEFHALYRQDRRGLFLDVVAQAGLQRSGWRGTGFGAVLVDFDADGSPDLAQVNGLVRRALPGQTPVAAGVDPWWARYAQRTQMFVNDGKGRFRDRSESETDLCGVAMVGRSLAVGDFDRDGAPDLVVGAIGGPVRLYRNQSSPRGHWLTLAVVDGSAGGREAIGAEVVVQSGSRTWWACLQPATSYLSSHEPVIHLGLGAAASCDRVEVRWPDGSREQFPGGGADQRRTLVRGTGQSPKPTTPGE